MAPQSDREKRKLLEDQNMNEYDTLMKPLISENYEPSNKIRHRKSFHRNLLIQFFQFANLCDKFFMIIGACCAIIQGSCFPVLSILFGQMTNNFISQTTNDLNTSTKVSSNYSEEFYESMIHYSTYYLIIAAIALITGFFQIFCWELVAERQVFRLRKIFFSQLLRQDISWFDQNESGSDLSVRLSDHLERVREGLGIKFSLVIQYTSTFISGLLVGFFVNWRLTTAIVLAEPLLIGVSVYMAIISANSAARELEKYALAGGIAEEVLSNIRTVAAFCKEIVEMKRYKAALEVGRKIAMHKYLIMSCGLGFVYFIMYASYGAAFYYGASLVHGGYCNPGSIFTIFFSVMAGAFSVGNALPFLSSVSTAVAALREIFNIIERNPEIDPYSNRGFKPRSVDGYIEMKRVSFTYPARPNTEVLHQVSIKVNQGQVVAFVGSSGSGKSTLVGLLLRFYDPTEGYITLDGKPLHQLNVNWLRNQIGLVAQEPILFSATIAENIRYGRSDVTQEEIEEAARLANAHHFIAKLPQGYNTQTGYRGSQLSGGQKQRIAIARALVRNPKILLLDEATSALDAYSEGIVQEALEKAMHGRTTIIIAHRLSTIRNADLIYVVKDGHISESGKHQELMNRKGVYYNLVLAQTLEKNKEEQQTLDWYEETEELKKSSRSSSVTSVCIIENNYLNGIEYEEEELPEVSTWQLVKFNSKEWFRLLLGITVCLITGTIMPLFSIFYGEMFVTFTLPRDQLLDSAKNWSIVLIVLAIVCGCSIFLQTICLTSAAEKLIKRMRSKAFNNILRQPVGWFDLPSSSCGFLVNRLARDAPLVKAAAGLRVGHFMTAVVTMGAGGCIAFTYGWKLALLLSLGVPFVAGAAYHQKNIMKKNEARDARLLDVAGRIASECIQNIRTVQALGTERLFVRQYMDSLSLPFGEAKTSAISFGAVYSLSQTVIYLMYAAAFRFGFYLVMNGDMVPADIYKVFFALSFCATSVGNTFSYMQDYSKAKYAARRMLQLINRKSEIDPTASFGVKPKIRGEIHFQDVHFTYPSRMEYNVLRGVSFSLNAGKSFALVGESGSGKSTVVSLFERFYNPTRGSIKVDGFDIGLINIHHLRRHIGIVSQEPNLFRCSIKDNIAYGLDSNESPAVVMQKVMKVAKIVNLHNLVSTLPQGYDTMVGEKGAQLSGGQKQRIAIARALIKNPKILLLDEATSALDTECEKVVQEALDRAQKGRTCITIAHRLCTIQNSDTIGVVHKGKIIEQGEHQDLLAKKGWYFKLTERQQIQLINESTS